MRADSSSNIATRQTVTVAIKQLEGFSMFENKSFHHTLPQAKYIETNITHLYRKHIVVNYGVFTMSTF